jgi:hypothetical protein
MEGLSTQVGSAGPKVDRCSGLRFSGRMRRRQRVWSGAGAEGRLQVIDFNSPCGNTLLNGLTTRSTSPATTH